MLDKQTIEENIKNWIKALESGEYTQGKWALKDIFGTYCCLGLACEHVLGLEPKLSTPANRRFFFEEEQAGVLTRSQADQLGLNHSEGVYGESSLVSDNDDYNRSFKDIATIIRSQPDGLFKEHYNLDD